MPPKKQTDDDKRIGQLELVACPARRALACKRRTRQGPRGPRKPIACLGHALSCADRVQRVGDAAYSSGRFRHLGDAAGVSVMGP